MTASSRFSMPVAAVVAVAAAFAAPADSARAVSIEIRYDYDTQGFFSQPGAKAALRAVCDFFEIVITDSLDEIDRSDWPAGYSWSAEFESPGSSDYVALPNLFVPADTIILFAGGKNITSAGRGGPGGFSATGNNAWFDVLTARGEAGVLATSPTDYALWGGTVTFDTLQTNGSPQTWNFSLTDSSAAGGIDFVPIALHELGHLLGVGTAESWQTTHVNCANHTFNGPASVAVYGGPVPLQAIPFPGPCGYVHPHWQDDGVCVFPTKHAPDNPLNVLSSTIAQFGAPGSQDQIAIMDPSNCDVGTTFNVFTELDLAALQDIGWEISYPIPTRDVPKLTLTYIAATGEVSISWLGQPDRAYEVQRSVNLAAWKTISAALQGAGAELQFIDTSPPARGAAYRLVIMPVAAPAHAAAVSSPSPSQSGDPISYMSRPPRFALGCPPAP